MIARTLRLLGLHLLAALPAMASAIEIPLINPSFESPTLALSTHPASRVAVHPAARPCRRGGPLLAVRA